MSFIIETSILKPEVFCDLKQIFDQGDIFSVMIELFWSCLGAVELE